MTQFKSLATNAWYALMSPAIFRSTLLMVLLGLLCGCAESSDDAIVAEPVRAIKYVVLGQERGAMTRTLSGHIRARESSQLSFQVSGQVLAIHVDVGDQVQRGDLIAELDARPYQLRLDTMDAELSAARSDFHERQENYLKQQRVFKDRYISRSELDRAKAEFEQSGSAVKLAESRLELARRDLENSRLLAPFTGTINSREIEPFEDVTASNSVFDIQGTAGFEVSLLLPSRLLSDVERGSEAIVAVPAIGLKGLSGIVSERGMRADSGGAYPLTVVLESGYDTRVQAGMSAEVTLTLSGEEGRLLLPDSAVTVDASGNQFVFRYDANESIVRRVAISTTLWGLDSLTVDQGLSPGDVICVAGVEFLRDGQRVSLYQSQR
jgi:RND family efflux transporter MFP subunit